MRHHTAAQIPPALHLLRHKGVNRCDFNDPESTKNTSELNSFHGPEYYEQYYYRHSYSR